MVDVGDGIGDLHDFTLEGSRRTVAFGEDIFSHLRAIQDAVPCLPGQIQALQLVHDSQTLLRVTEPLGKQVGKRLLTRMTERRVSDVISKSDRFGQVLVHV